jgi:hypothetical protein
MLKGMCCGVYRFFSFFLSLEEWVEELESVSPSDDADDDEESSELSELVLYKVRG